MKIPYQPTSISAQFIDWAGGSSCVLWIFSSSTGTQAMVNGNGISSASCLFSSVKQMEHTECNPKITASPSSMGPPAHLATSWAGQRPFDDFGKIYELWIKKLGKWGREQL